MEPKNLDRNPNGDQSETPRRGVPPQNDKQPIPQEAIQEAMGEIRNVMLQYTKCSDPTESEAACGGWFTCCDGCEEHKGSSGADSEMAELVAMELDLLSLDSVARFAGAWNARLGPLHVLINNAGIFAMGGWLVFKLEKSVSEVMVLDGFVSSPLRRPHALKKQWEDLGSCSTVAQRHRDDREREGDVSNGTCLETEIVVDYQPKLTGIVLCCASSAMYNKPTTS
ncbi:hypothetical protein YC2023_078400 [Brassica napus]